jgi:hypothetical protein
MSKKVFVLGAGFNQFLKQSFGNPTLKAARNLGYDYPKGYSENLAPPMSRNFF